MASTSSRRGMSHRLSERQNARGDDPWCLICGVNLALDGRTFSIVSNHQNSEISDVLVRVLGMKFTEDQASVNVCNRCERQLKRIGRTTNNAVARTEARQFRDQAEKHLAKHVNTGVELGDIREINSSSSAARSVKSIRDGAVTSSRAVQRGTSFDANSSTRNTREHYSRSSSVRFDDTKDDETRRAYNRDHSAPERIAQKRERELVSSWDETNKSKDIRRGNRSSVYSTSVERTSSSRTSSTDQKSTLERKSQQRASMIRDKTGSIPKPKLADPSKKLAKVSPGTMATNNGENENSNSHEDIKKAAEAVDSPRVMPRKIQSPEKDVDFRALSPEQTNPFIFGEHAIGDDSSDTTGHFGNDTTTEFREDLDRLAEDTEYSPRNDNVEEDTDESPIKIYSSGITVSLASNESCNQGNSNRENDDSLTNSMTAEETMDYNNESNDDRQNSERNEGTDDIVADDNKDRTKKPKVTFSENVFSDDTRDEHQPERATLSETTRNDKGKLSKYESLDLEIDNSNPFFDDVYCEYNRRVYVNSRVKNIGAQRVIKRGLEKPEGIPETEDTDESEKSTMVPVPEGAEIRSNGFPSNGFNDDAMTYQMRTPFDDSSDDQDETLTGNAVKEISVSGEDHQDSTPLIKENEENKEDIIHPGESGDAVDGVNDDNDDKVQSLKVEDDEQDERDEGSQTGAPKQEDDGEVMVNEVIQVTHLAQPVNHDLVDSNQSESVSSVMVSPCENESQISLPPAQSEDARGVKSEASPLIDKDGETSDKKGKKGNDSKFKDQQPGFACCTIL